MCRVFSGDPNSITTDVYMQEILESVQAKVNFINREFRKCRRKLTSHEAQQLATAVAFRGRGTRGLAGCHGIIRNDQAGKEEPATC
jgi:hypothetical protein